MKKKIEWFQEVLSLEPGSRVFFPLARLYVEIGELENAAITLGRGLDRHPEHLEARMLHIQVLSDLERMDQALDEVKRVVEPLQGYPAFWRLWAQGQPEENRDFAVFLMLVAAGMQGETIHWTDVMLEGVNALSERLVGPLPDLSPSPPLTPESEIFSAEQDDEQDDELDESGAPSTLRTRTMADVLAAQGDFNGALDIYNELWSCSGGQEKQELKGRIDKIEAGLEGEKPVTDADQEDAFSQHAKNRLISTLETLASRFEARIRS